MSSSILDLANHAPDFFETGAPGARLIGAAFKLLLNKVKKRMLIKELRTAILEIGRLETDPYVIDRLSEDKNFRDYVIMTAISVDEDKPFDGCCPYFVHNGCPDEKMSSASNSVWDLVIALRRKISNSKHLRKLVNDEQAKAISASLIEEIYRRNDSYSSGEKRIRDIRPIPLGRFEGREEELDAVRFKLKECGIAIINGFGGYGKTELAKKIAYEYVRDNGGTRVAWIEYEGSMKSSFARNLDVIGLDKSAMKDDEERFSALTSYLTADDLIVIDNYSFRNGDFGDIENLPCRFIVTTRDQNISDYEPVTVDRLTEDQALRLLLNCAKTFVKTGIRNNEEVFRELLRKIDYHTLTVTLIGALLDRSIDIECFRKRIFDISDRQVFNNRYKMDRYDTILGYLRAVFDMSSFSDEEKNLMRILAIPPKEGIDYDWLKECTDFGDRLEDVLNSLFDSNWAKYEDNGDRSPRISIHPLIGELMNRSDDLPEGSNTVRSAFISSYIGKLDALSKSGNKVLELYSQTYMFGSILEYIKDDGDNVEIITVMGKCLRLCGLHEDSLRFIQKALDIRQRVLPADHPDIASSYNNIGLEYSALGNHQKALKYMMKALDIW